MCGDVTLLSSFEASTILKSQRRKLKLRPADRQGLQGRSSLSENTDTLELSARQRSVFLLCL